MLNGLRNYERALLIFIDLSPSMANTLDILLELMKTNPNYAETVYQTCSSCVYNSTGDANGTRMPGHPKCDPCRRYSNWAKKTSRIDVIGQNGNDGGHYKKGLTDAEVTHIAANLLKRPTHYSGWDVARFADQRKYDLYQFNILKYIDRHELKDGKKDLLKALDYLQEYINVRYPEEK